LIVTIAEEHKKGKTAKKNIITINPSIIFFMLPMVIKYSPEKYKTIEVKTNNTTCLIVSLSMILGIYGV
jgi:hypothetical protein